jgi:hypothetical protein
MGELGSLGGKFTPSFASWDEHSLLFRKTKGLRSLGAGGPTFPMGANFTPGEKNWPRVTCPRMLTQSGAALSSAVMLLNGCIIITMSSLAWIRFDETTSAEIYGLNRIESNLIL